MADYEQHHYDKDLLKQSATNLGSIEVNPISDLEQARTQITKYCDENPEFPKLTSEWCFVDCKIIILLIIKKNILNFTV